MVIDALKVFATVVEMKNFSRAAEELYMSQPSVSLHIRNLENDFGTKLIHRSSKQLKLTQTGEILYRRAKQIIQLFEEAREEINRTKNVVTGALKIGASFTIGEYILPRLLAEFALQYPKVEIEVKIANTQEIAQAVRANELDIALVEGELDYPDLRVEPFMEDEMILVVPKSHPLAKAPVVTTENLQDQVWIFRENGSGTRAFSDRLIGEYGLRVKRSFVFGSNQGVKEAVLAGLGIAIISKWVVHKNLEGEELAAVTLEGPRLTRRFSIVQGKDPVISKAGEVFLERLVAYDYGY